MNIFNTLIAAAMSGAFEPTRHIKSPYRKCLLRDCIETTKHNGGYCCAEHKRLDHEQRRNREAKTK